MLLASALGFIKLLSLAYAMPAYEYGQYVTYFGIAAFSSLLMSFGLTEKTIKDYPRRWVTGQRRMILTDATRIGRILALRFLVAGTVGVALSFFGMMPIMPIVVIWITGLSLCTVLLALVGSLYRATGSQKALQNFTCWRSAVVLGVALPAGWLLGWQGAIGGDIVGNLMGIVFSIWQLPQLYRDEPCDESSAYASTSAENSHFQLYLANLAVAPQSMLDRGWVSNAIGPALAGSYGVIMLVPQVAQLLVNVVAQHIGPLVIKLVHLQQHGTSRQSNIGFNAVLLALFSLALTLATLIAKRLPYLDHLFAKFEISDISLAMAGVIASGQIYCLIEFHLIARDREEDVLAASLASCLIFLGSFAVASVAHGSIEWFLVGAGAARWGQVWLLRRAYLRYA